MAETTPFLGHDYDDFGGESHPIKTSPANSHFKRPLKLLTSMISFFSIAAFGVVIASYVLVSTGPFEYIWSTQESLRDLAIVLFVNFLVTTPTIFFQLPIIINIATHIAMSVVLFVFSTEQFGNGWPDSSFCRRWQYNPEPPYRNRPLPESAPCQKARNDVRIMIVVSAGVGILIGVLTLNALLLRVIGLTRTRFWVGKNYGSFKKLGWNPTGFTVTFTLSVLPNKQETGTERAGREVADAQTSATGEQSRLIET